MSNVYTISADGMIIHDNQRLFPLGYIMNNTFATDFRLISCVSSTVSYAYYGGSTSSPAYADAAKVYGLNAILGVAQDAITNVTEAAKDTWYSGFFSAIGNRENVLGYYNLDEAITVQKLAPAVIEDIYNRIKANRPNSLVFYDDYTVAAATAAKNAYDVLTCDLYPIGTSFGSTMEVFRNIFKGMVAAASPKPSILLLQTFFTADLRWMEPTAQELRIIAYIALANKSRGLIGFSWSYAEFVMTDHLDFLLKCNNLFSELKALLPILKMPDSASITATTTSKIDILVKSSSPTRCYLICANYASGAFANGRSPGVDQNNAKITLSGFSATGKYRGLVPQTFLSSYSSSSFVVSLPAYTPQIYEVIAS